MYASRYMWIWSNDKNSSKILEGDLPYHTAPTSWPYLLYYYYCVYTPLERGTFDQMTNSYLT